VETDRELGIDPTHNTPFVRTARTRQVHHSLPSYSSPHTLTRHRLPHRLLHLNLLEFPPFAPLVTPILAVGQVRSILETRPFLRGYCHAYKNPSGDSVHLSGSPRLAYGDATLIPVDPGRGGGTIRSTFGPSLTQSLRIRALILNVLLVGQPIVTAIGTVTTNAALTRELDPIPTPPLGIRNPQCTPKVLSSLFRLQHSGLPYRLFAHGFTLPDPNLFVLYLPLAASWDVSYAFRSVPWSPLGY